VSISNQDKRFSHALIYLACEWRVWAGVKQWQCKHAGAAGNKCVRGLTMALFPSRYQHSTMPDEIELLCPGCLHFSSRQVKTYLTEWLSFRSGVATSKWCLGSTFSGQYQLKKAKTKG